MIKVGKLINFEFLATDIKTEGTTSKKAAEIEEKEQNLKQAQPNTRAKRASQHRC